MMPRMQGDALEALASASSFTKGDTIMVEVGLSRAREGGKLLGRAWRCGASSV